jgi:hypothetical protein
MEPEDLAGVDEFDHGFVAFEEMVVNAGSGGKPENDVPARLHAHEQGFERLAGLGKGDLHDRSDLGRQFWGGNRLTSRHAVGCHKYRLLAQKSTGIEIPSMSRSFHISQSADLSPRRRPR